MIVWFTIHLYQEGGKNGQQDFGLKKKRVFCWIVSWFLTQMKSSSSPRSASHLSSSTSLVSSLISMLSLDDGVPVEVILDVFRSEHASHLEVAQGQSVLLLLAQLVQMPWTRTRSRDFNPRKYFYVHWLFTHLKLDSKFTSTSTAWH